MKLINKLYAQNHQRNSYAGVVDIDKTKNLNNNNEDKMIVWGYLTSQNDKKNTHILTNYQIFSENNKTQYVRLVTPYIAMTKDVGTLPEDQLDKIKPYLESEEVLQKLTKIFQEEIKPSLKNELMLYDGVGITNEDIDKVLVSFDKQEDKRVEKYLKKYKAKLNQGLVTKDWLNNIKYDDLHAYKRLLILIKDYENH